MASGTMAVRRAGLDLTSPVEPHVFTLANPYRVVIDLPDTAFQSGLVPVEGRGLVSAYRFGLISRGMSRIGRGSSATIDP